MDKEDSIKLLQMWIVKIQSGKAEMDDYEQRKESNSVEDTYFISIKITEWE